MARDSAYSNLVVPVAASYPVGGDGCCESNLSAGAEGARSAQQRSTDDLQAIQAAARDGDAGKRRTRGFCRCWWVALAAVVAIAVVANK